MSDGLLSGGSVIMQVKSGLSLLWLAVAYYRGAAVYADCIGDGYMLSDYGQAPFVFFLGFSCFRASSLSAPCLPLFCPRSVCMYIVTAN